jgi:hypothetical protein
MATNAILAFRSARFVLREQTGTQAEQAAIARLRMTARRRHGALSAFATPLPLNNTHFIADWYDR